MLVGSCSTSIETGQVQCLCLCIELCMITLRVVKPACTTDAQDKGAKAAGAALRRAAVGGGLRVC